MSSIAQNHELLKHLFELLQAHRRLFKQERTYQRVVALVLAELFVFARHTITQLLMGLGQTQTDWSSWYRLLSQRRFRYEQASEVLFGETLKHVGADEVYVVAGDATQTPRSSRKLEGAGWLRNLRTPPFAAIHGGHPCGAALVQRQLADSAAGQLQPGGAHLLATSLHGEVEAAGA
jgi:hypothetical protein